MSPPRESCFLCGEETTSQSWQTCSKCDFVACSPQCFKVHFGQNGCIGFKIQENDKVGRFLIATKRIKPQEIVLRDPPLLMAPQSLPVCLVCLKPLTEVNLAPTPSSKTSRNASPSRAETESGSFCQRCNYPMCSVQCASAHPCHYQEECELLAKVAISPAEDIKVNQPSLLFSMIGVLRLLLLQEKLQKPFDKVWISKLMDHKDDLFKDQVMSKHIGSMSRLLLEEMGLGNRFNEEQVVHAFGVLRINSFGIDTPMGGRGRGLFPLLALMSHSCQSNLQHEQSKSTSAMVLSAQRPIEAGEELTIRYIDTIQVGFLERQQLLEEQWYFKCGCTRCKDPTDAGTWSNSISCFQCAKPRLTPFFATGVGGDDDMVKWACQECQAVAQNSNVKELLENCRTRWNNSLQASRRNCNLTPSFNLITQMKQHPLSRWHFEVMKMSFSLAKLYCQLGPISTKEDITNWKILTEDILQFLNLMDPGMTKIIATFLLQHNKAKLTLDKLNFDDGQMSREDYLQSIKQTVILENRAQKVLQEEP